MISLFCGVVVDVVVVDLKHPKKRQRLRQRQRKKAVILLVKRGRNDHAARAARIFEHSLQYSSKLLREFTKFEVLRTTWTNYSESFSLAFTLYTTPAWSPRGSGSFTLNMLLILNDEKTSLISILLQ